MGMEWLNGKLTLFVPILYYCITRFASLIIVVFHFFIVLLYSILLPFIVFWSSYTERVALESIDKPRVDDISHIIEVYSIVTIGTDAGNGKDKQYKGRPRATNRVYVYVIDGR